MVPSFHRTSATSASHEQRLAALGGPAGHDAVSATAPRGPAAPTAISCKNNNFL